MVSLSDNVNSSRSQYAAAPSDRDFDPIDPFEKNIVDVAKMLHGLTKFGIIPTM